MGKPPRFLVLNNLVPIKNRIKQNSQIGRGNIQYIDVYPHKTSFSFLVGLHRALKAIVLKKFISHYTYEIPRYEYYVTVQLLF
jgi:hypothetical protein